MTSIVRPCSLNMLEIMTDLNILPATQHLRPDDELDLIARGVITLQDAKGFFTLYRQRLDRFFYNILEEHDSLASICKSSPFLTAAVCVVSAFHDLSPQYQNMSRTFRPTGIC